MCVPSILVQQSTLSLCISIKGLCSLRRLSPNICMSCQKLFCSLLCLALIDSSALSLVSVCMHFPDEPPLRNSPVAMTLVFLCDLPPSLISFCRPNVFLLAGCWSHPVHECACISSPLYRSQIYTSCMEAYSYIFRSSL